ncbi:MAG: DUF1501 domain-containing protein [Ignavibacteria bacterium]|nr:DUF1501 domain-containing protein [Ignavibacteria bacterium]
MSKVTRRDFFKFSALASASMMIPNFIRPLQAKEITEKFLASGAKKLVIVQLSGGNDGLNTVIPYKNDIYYSSRNSISIAEKDVLKITDELGFNPAMPKFKSLYESGYLSIINNVGYPNPDRSHFRSMDIWQSASASDKYVTSGWIGRYLDSECPDCKNPYNAIEVSDTLSLALKGEKYNGIAVENPEKFFMSASEQYFTDIANANKDKHNDENVSYLYKTIVEATSSAEYVYKTSKIYKSKTEYPKGQFSSNLKTIAELIVSGIDTQVFYVSLGGFDTHINQNGKQDTLLKELSEGLFSFTEDLKSNDKLGDVFILTFSEFGRRVKQNASGGTDHGTANNIFVINGNLKKPGFYNSAPDLTSLDNGDLKYEIDFRNIYAEILNKWLNVNDKKILGGSFNGLNLI